MSFIYTRSRIFMNEVTLCGRNSFPLFLRHKLFAPLFLSLSKIRFLQFKRQPVAYIKATSVELTNNQKAKLFVTCRFYVRDMTLYICCLKIIILKKKLASYNFEFRISKSLFKMISCVISKVHFVDF